MSPLNSWETFWRTLDRAALQDLERNGWRVAPLKLSQGFTAERRCDGALVTGGSVRELVAAVERIGEPRPGTQR